MREGKGNSPQSVQVLIHVVYSFEFKKTFIHNNNNNIQRPICLDLYRHTGTSTSRSFIHYWTTSMYGLTDWQTDADQQADRHKECEWLEMPPFIEMYVCVPLDSSFSLSLSFSLPFIPSPFAFPIFSFLFFSFLRVMKDKLSWCCVWV